MLRKTLFAALAVCFVFTAGCRKKVDLPDRKLASCPAGMANVDGKLCIDKYEYPNAKDKYPLVNVDWKTAADLCKQDGKRLCTSDEWIYACQSGKGNKLPYGNSEKDVCNTNEKFKEKDRAVKYDFDEIAKANKAVADAAAFGLTENNKKLMEKLGEFLTAQEQHVTLLSDNGAKEYKDNEKKMNDAAKEIYEKIFPELKKSDRDELEAKVLPTAGPALADYLYALERNLVFKYAADKKTFSFERTQFTSGSNEECVSEQGVEDMVGNVWEWTGDSDQNAVYRGGDSAASSGADFKQCAPTFRDYSSNPSNYKGTSVGFRCCQ